MIGQGDSFNEERKNQIFLPDFEKFKEAQQKIKKKGRKQETKKKDRKKKKEEKVEKKEEKGEEWNVYQDSIEDAPRKPICMDQFYLFILFYFFLLLFYQLLIRVVRVT